VVLIRTIFMPPQMRPKLGISPTTNSVDNLSAALCLSNLATTASMERVEVLRGPQSAQFGRATFSGAVHYITRKPTNEFEGEFVAELTAFKRGNFMFESKRFNNASNLNWMDQRKLVDFRLGCRLMYGQQLSMFETCWTTSRQLHDAIIKINS